MFHKLERMGVHCWRDMNADDLTTDGMRQGVLDSDAFVLMLSNSVRLRIVSPRVNGFVGWNFLLRCIVVCFCVSSFRSSTRFRC